MRLAFLVGISMAQTTKPTPKSSSTSISTSGISFGLDLPNGLTAPLIVIIAIASMAIFGSVGYYAYEYYRKRTVGDELASEDFARQQSNTNFNTRYDTSYNIRDGAQNESLNYPQTPEQPRLAIETKNSMSDKLGQQTYQENTAVASANHNYSANIIPNSAQTHFEGYRHHVPEQMVYPYNPQSISYYPTALMPAQQFHPPQPMYNPNPVQLRNNLAPVYHEQNMFTQSYPAVHNTEYQPQYGTIVDESDDGYSVLNEYLQAEHKMK